ncbi:MAG TPA: SdrD B-like domain-containing protein [Ignavibacteriales bacterium]|nr:SdrD B-like domain-containing protein [Ignavibacteriales bacterium]
MKALTFRNLLAIAILLLTSNFLLANSGSCDLSGFLTYTQGGWGAAAHGKNPGSVRDKYFSQVFPSGLTVGGQYTMKFTTSQSIQNYLGGQGTPSKLTNNYTNPTSTESGTFGVQMVALTLNVYFDDAGKIGSNALELKDLVILSGKFAGKTVSEFLALANRALGGEAISGYTYSDFNDAATKINENFDNGTADEGFLTCPSTPKPVSLGDKVWLDSDMDGIQASTEEGIENITVQLYDCSGAFIKETTTDLNGNYYFKNLNPGDYKVKFVLPEEYLFTKKDMGSDEKDSDADLTTGFTSCYTLASGDNNCTVDAGIYEKPAPAKASIGNLVWNDLNQNGIQDNGEQGIANVTVELYTCSGTLVSTTTTNSNGIYGFTGLNAGDYKVKFILPASYTFSPKDASAANDETDSDADLTTGFTTCYTLNAGDVNNSLDAGMYQVQENLKADLSLTKTVDNANPKNGDRVTFTVTLTNNGPDDAHGVFVSDLLMQGLDFISATASLGEYDNTTGRWTVGTITKNESATLTVVVKVNAGTLMTGTVDLGTASNYNLFVLQDLSQPSSDTQGRLAVGRDAVLSNYSVGDQLSATPGSDVLVVGRNLTFTSGDIYYGNVVYGNSTNLPIDQVGITGGTLRQGTPVDFDAARTYLRNLSTQLASSDTNGTVEFQWGGLTLRGTTPLLNVFNLSGDVLSKSNSMTIDVPNGAVVLVNVSGDSVSWTGGLTVNGTDVSNVLYNFHQARALKIQGIDVRGSILAPFADVNFPAGQQNGQMICSSLTGRAQFNNVRFIGNIPAERKISNIAEVTAAIEHDPDSTPGNGVETEDDFAKVLVTVSPASDNGSGNTGGGSGGNTEKWQHVADFTSGEIIWNMTSDNDGNLLAGTWGGKIYKTEDNGQTWGVLNSGMQAAYIWSIVVNSEGRIFAGTEKGVFTSSDNGKTWTETALKGVDVRSLIEVSDVLYAGVWGKGVYKSLDNGETWTEVNKGLTCLAVHALAVSSKGDIFAGTFGGGVFKSNDGGISWTDLNAGYPFIWALGTTSEGSVYAGTYGDGVYYSNDGGTSWSRSNNGLASLFIYSVTVDNKDNVYLSSWAGGVYTASGNGTVWNSLGMAGQGVSTVAVNPKTGSLYVGTSQGSVYSTALSVTGVEVKKDVPTKFTLEQNYPNPFNPSTSIKFSIPVSGSYSLKVYDVLGKEVAALINGELKEGNYNVSFNAENLSTGVYIYHLQGSNVSISKKMVLMK